MNETAYNLVNSLLAGGLVFLGSLSSGNITFNGICLALIASGIVALSKFKDFWTKKGKIYKLSVFNFI
jgi:hypothetical protein